MAKLGQQARFSARGDRNVHAAVDSALENRGFALWSACQGKIRTSKAPLTKGPSERGVGDVDGYEIEVNLKRKCFDLWPELNQMDKQSQESFSSEIYAYLRASGNAVCVRQPGVGPGIPVWWLRATWNDVKAVGVFKQTELTNYEKRLTAREAGEDRPPAPVTVKQREDVVAAASPSATQTADKRKPELVQLVKDSSEPVYHREIADKMGLSQLMVGRLLRELVEAGELHRRLESTDERPADASGRYRFLYWTTKRIPPRKTQLEVTSRTMGRVNSLKPGESLATHWMTPGPLQEIQELVDAGILEYFEKIDADGKPEQRIRLATQTPVTEATEETAPEPAPTALTGVVTPPPGDYIRPDYPGALRAMADNLERALADIGNVAELRAELEAEQARASRAERALIDARTELSEARRERDAIQQKFDAARALFG